MQSWKEFLLESYKSIKLLNGFANALINMSSVKKNDSIVDAGAGIGLVSTNIFKKHKNVNVIAIDNDESCIEELNKLAKKYPNLKVLNNNLECIELHDNSVNKVIDRASLMHCKEKFNILKEYYRILKPNSQISMFEVILYDKLDRYYDYLPLETENYDFYKNVEEKVRNDLDDPLTNYDLNLWKQTIKDAGFKNINIITIAAVDYFKIKEKLDDANVFYEDKPHLYSLKEKFLKHMTQEQFDVYYKTLEQSMLHKTLKHTATILYIFAQKEPSIISHIALKLRVLKFMLLRKLPESLKYNVPEIIMKLMIDRICFLERCLVKYQALNPQEQDSAKEKTNS